MDSDFLLATNIGSHNKIHLYKHGAVVGGKFLGNEMTHKLNIKGQILLSSIQLFLQEASAGVSRTTRAVSHIGIGPSSRHNPKM